MKQTVLFMLILLSSLCCKGQKNLVSVMIETDKETFNPVLEPNVTGSISVIGLYSDGSRKPIGPDKASLSVKTKASSGNVEVVRIEGGKIVPVEGGVATVRAIVIDEGSTWSATKDIVVRPFYHDYHQTLVLKLFMGMEGEPVERLSGEPLFQREHDVICTFAQALEVIKKVDNLTCQIPKIIYLVGWQKGGHDHLFPAWDEVNPRLKRSEDSTALESLRWLIREAKQYHTTVSLHINMVDAYQHSSLWEEYEKKDVIAKDANGKIRSSGIAIQGDSMYHVVYPLEWETGLAQRRIDGLIAMIPELAEQHTIHVDVFIAQREDGSVISPWHAKPENGGFTIDKYVDTQRKIFKYWRERGFDVTGEGILWAHPPGEGFYGLQPMAWWYPGEAGHQMQIPENLTARGRTSRTDQGDYRFGSSMHGEELFLKDLKNLPGFLNMFCLTTLPWMYLSRHNREAFVDEVLYYADGIKAGDENGKKIIRKGDYVLRENDNLFVEAVWKDEKEKEIIAYSETGYENKTWRMPAAWNEVDAVDIYRITMEGPKLIAEKKVVKNHELTLSLEKTTGIIITPSNASSLQIIEFKDFDASGQGKSTGERYILTPPPAPAPRINGAKIVGASPCKPFLFTIAASGERPMKFSIKNLPKGLTLDKEKGVISGLCKQPGRYKTLVTAQNAKGKCSDTIEIVMEGQLALTPHIGWNSWYIYATGITQEIMEKSAQAMYDEGLTNFGYTFVNIDDGWEIKAGSNDPVIGGPVRHPDGTIRTNKNFPDMKRLTDYIHSLGMKAGLYSSPGRTTCGGYAGSFGHEAQDIKTFADWGFDFLKYDWCSYGNETQSQELEELQKPYRLISKLCKESDRDIILNMCQYGMGDVWKWGKEAGGNSWRTTYDIGDTKNLIDNMFKIGFFQEQLKAYSGPGGWNDPDYLLFGNIYSWEQKTQIPSPYSPDEHYTCMTLWCMMSAPLIFSGDVTTLDDFTKNILCNAEVIDVNQDKLGKQGNSIYNQDMIEIWRKELSDGTTAIAVFNKRPLQSRIKLNWEKLGYNKNHNIRDLWRQINLGTTKNINSFDIPSHGCVLLKLK